jgi:hypothetical protein
MEASNTTGTPWQTADVAVLMLICGATLALTVMLSKADAAVEVVAQVALPMIWHWKTSPLFTVLTVMLGLLVPTAMPF